MYLRFPFQNLTRNISYKSWRQQPLYDPTRRSQPGAGIVSSGLSVTSVEYSYNFMLERLTDDDKELLEDFEVDVGYGACRFDLRASDGEDYQVRFAETLKFERDPAMENRWQVPVSIYGKKVNKMQITNIPIEDLAANADIASRPIFVCPSNDVTISTISILTQGSPAGVDDSDTVVIAVKDDAANTLVSKTYNTANQPPSSDYADLGSLSNETLEDGEHLTLSVTQGTTANMPAFLIIIEWYYTY